MDKMIIGILTLELFFPYARSIKDKRRILHGLKDRIREKYNVALAEINFQDKWQRSTLGVVAINSQAHVVEEILHKVINDAMDLPDSEIVGQNIRYV